ncbi:MAG TPA: serine hydrolase domain-containing protein [Blastocatellia bacterium]|nr:serine hydrolase domain-containing protein [Blastocatellia bacterium]
MKHRSLLLILFLATLLPAQALPLRSVPVEVGPQAARASVGELRKSVRAKLEELHSAAEFPGVTAGVVLADGRSFSVSAGLADLESKRRLRPSDRMLSGSIGKTYVAAVMLQLVEEGRAGLDDKIERWFGREAWFARLPNAKDITLRMLMNHTSGIAEHVLMKEFIARLREDPDKAWAPEELISYVLDSKPLFPAGQGWSYADTNYILVGMIIERITRNTYYSELRKRILERLDLDDTIPSNTRVLPGVITGYSRPNSPFGFEGRVIIDGRFIINPQMEWTGGGLATTPEDLARWAKALYEGKVIKRESLDEMLKGVEAKTGPGDKYGLGVQIRQSDWGVSYGHSGWFPGYLSNMEYFADHRVAIAVQFNTDAGARIKKNYRQIVADIAHIVIGEPQAGKPATTGAR